jgi:hypothetical protein
MNSSPASIFAYDILSKDSRIAQLEKELAYYKPYKEKYDKLLDQGFEYQQSMTGQVLTLLLNKGDFPKEYIDTLPTDAALDVA